MTAEIMRQGFVSVVTGAASGIGRAAARRFAQMGMKVCIADVAAEGLEAAREEIAAVAPGGAHDVMAAAVDIVSGNGMELLARQVAGRLGPVGLLMNNAVTRVGGGVWDDPVEWRRAMDVNFWGVVNGVRAFVPLMMKQETPSIVINCGSKQGITNPPGNAAYNVTKAALKTYTEALQHELRNTPGCRVSAHLLVPGWTTTRDLPHQEGAWLPDQVVDYMLAALERDDFYILCPDDEVTPEMDRTRILWAAGDITENRPPLSRWHPDFADAFARFSA